MLFGYYPGFIRKPGSIWAKYYEMLTFIDYSVLAQLFLDPRIDQATISLTRVDLSNDLSHARINISVLGDQAKQEEMINAVRTARGYIRSELARRLKVKHAPEIEFRLDKSIEHGIRIASILEELKDESKSDKG
jgi:ribosome-binding factor A